MGESLKFMALGPGGNGVVVAEDVGAGEGITNGQFWDLWHISRALRCGHRHGKGSDRALAHAVSSNLEAIYFQSADTSPWAGPLVSSSGAVRPSFIAAA